MGKQLLSPVLVYEQLMFCEQLCFFSYYLQFQVMIVLYKGWSLEFQPFQHPMVMWSWSWFALTTACQAPQKINGQVSKEDCKSPAHVHPPPALLHSHCVGHSPPTPSLKCAMTLVHPHTISLLCNVSVVHPHAPFLSHLVSLTHLPPSLTHMVHLLHMPSQSLHPPPWLVPLILRQVMLRCSQTSVYPCTPPHIFPAFMVPLMLPYPLVILHPSPAPHAHEIAKMDKIKRRRENIEWIWWKLFWWRIDKVKEGVSRNLSGIKKLKLWYKVGWNWTENLLEGAFYNLLKWYFEEWNGNMCCKH